MRLHCMFIQYITDRLDQPSVRGESGKVKEILNYFTEAAGKKSTGAGMVSFQAAVSLLHSVVEPDCYSSLLTILITACKVQENEHHNGLLVQMQSLNCAHLPPS